MQQIEKLLRESESVIEISASYDALLADHRKEVLSFYILYEKALLYSKQVMTRESSIQLVLQICVLIHQFRDFPAIELIFPNYDIVQNSASILWITGLILQLVSLILSAYTTLALPIEVFTMRVWAIFWFKLGRKCFRFWESHWF